MPPPIRQDGSQFADGVREALFSSYDGGPVASVAVDIRIGQLMDAPNVGATAVLPLDIFESR